MKPSIFIGSSAEALAIAYAIQENLEFQASCQVWTDNFDLSSNTLEELIRATNNFAFAIFVMSADDISKVRDKKVTTARDNVIFELGLFMGRLGPKRVFFLIPRDVEDLHIPTDLWGITPGTYESGGGGDLRTKIGPFCNKVRRQIIEVHTSHENNEGPKTKLNQTEYSEAKTKSTYTTFQEVEYGIWQNNMKKSKIVIKPSDFLQSRIEKSFPGLRGVNHLNDPKIAVARLLKLLKEPIMFDIHEFDGYPDPVWWFRDGQSMYIKEVRKLSDTMILLNHFELEIDKISVYNATNYSQSFVYVQSHSVQPFNDRHLEREDIAKSKIKGEPFLEELAISGGNYVTRAEYDDGAAEINGQIIELGTGELRTKMLTPFNFIIAAKDSRVNSVTFDVQANGLFNAILVGQKSLTNLIELIKDLPDKVLHRTKGYE